VINLIGLGMDITQQQYDQANREFYEKNKDYIKPIAENLIKLDQSKCLLIEFLDVTKEIIDNPTVENINNELIPLAIKTARFLNL
jgi:hypothetical protein